MLKRNTSKKRILSSVVCVFLGILPLDQGLVFSSEPSLNELAKISTPTGVSLSVEIAETVDKRSQGLMFRQSLEADEGMLFIFPEMGYWTFWMKNTLIPLDILWMDESGKILHVEPHVPICTKKDDSCPRYYSTRESRFVLEIQAGRAKELGLTPGTHLSLTIPSKQPTR
ncbi:MAG: DUF192 domain-containing protein [Nitrospirales bacterium]